ncbi:MAG: glycosyltransferase, partial [Gemmatimonadota bacterium]|nr:glycosyltransferase [Gemmatimonadota bacterium]
MGDITTDGLQQDIYQRYCVLARLLTAAFPLRDKGTLVRILDIGSGPARLTERFLPAYFNVTRADVDTFGDAGVVPLTRGASLPFESDSFAAVIALEVLEHVPAEEREALIDECTRVSSDVVVFCCPVASELTTRAEEIFQSLALEMSGNASPFLAEHKSVGLPAAAAVRAALERRRPHVVDLPNSPLPEWLVYNLIDLAYACDFGDTDEKARFNVRVNARTPLAAEGPHYRRFFVGCTHAQTRDRVAEAAGNLSSGVTDPLDAPIGMAEALVHFRADLLRKHADGMRDALQAKDAHIRKLDDLIAKLQCEPRQEAVLPAPHAGAPIELAGVPASPVHADPPARRPEAPPTAPHDRADRPQTLLRQAHSRFRTWRVGRRLPREWRALAARSGLFDVDFYRAQHPDVAASGVDPIVHYLAVGASEGRNPHPLFDGAYYLTHAPGVSGSGNNPLIHYITQGGAEGRRPHPLFDSGFYVACHPEAARGDSTPLAHYVATGAQTRWDPSPVFWSGYYLETNPDVAAAGVNPLAHYVVLGAREGRNPNPLFDAAYYRARAGAVLPAAADPLLHYLSEGAAVGCDPHPLFSTRHYLATYHDVAAADVNPLSHYLLHGGAEARNPNPLFDAAWYRATEPVPPGSNPLVYYLREGETSGRSPHPLFDASFYAAAHPEVAGGPANALAHYLATGAQTRWDPSPLFSAAYYLERNPDVAAAGVNPLVHYVLEGAADGRSPNPFFDGAYYLARNPDVVASGMNPLVHYLLTGAAEGRKPSALFDTSHYLQQNPDVAAAGVNPLAHYLAYGRKERRPPNPLFDPVFYLSSNPDVAAADADPLLHFVEHGAAEGRDPSESFDTSYYVRENADVAAAGLNPLAHYLDHGREEGRRARAPETSVAGPGYTRFVPPVGLLPWFNPLNLRVEPSLDNTPSLNVLVPGLAMEHMSGGPNTALHLAYRLAASGVSVRLISTDAPMSHRDVLWDHLLRLTGGDRRLPNIEFADAHDRGHSLAIGGNDLFFATAWWTAQMAKFATELTRHRQFIYLVQDYEPLLHAASTSQALAEETYSLDFMPVVNSRILFDFLTGNRIGRFAGRDFADEALVFEPAVDRSRFFVEHPDPERPRRLLFYARPTKGLRNLFELGTAALMDAVARGVFSDTPWELLAMGEPISPVELGRGITLTPAPWRDFDGYAAQMRQADVLLSLMLSPHPSYPPLEMSACGGLTVTTIFGCKTAERLASVSDKILGAPATIEGVADGIVAAVARIEDPRNGPRGGALDLPSTWDESLEPILPALHSWLLRRLGAPLAAGASPPAESGTGQIACGFERWPGDAYETFRLDRMHRRTRAPAAAESDHTPLSLVTTAWNTEPEFLEYLARSVFQQNGAPPFEWVIIDNGTDRPDTRQCLAELGTHPAVRLHRVEQNLGIAGGMRLALERSRNRYILPVDSDDYLYPDCLQLVGRALMSHGFPPLLYTDEDKFTGHEWRDPYFKPDWDPVLFVNSCYIAHLCAIDRQLAVDLGCYGDWVADGSHDWETFTRFLVAGHAPVHLPEVLYGWRMHSGSTAGNIASKPYVVSSQRGVLTRLLAARTNGDRFTVEKSPLFGDTPDWWLRRLPIHPRPITTVLYGDAAALEAGTRPTVDARIPHQIKTVSGPAALNDLRQIARECAARHSLLHLLAAGVEPE